MVLGLFYNYILNITRLAHLIISVMAESDHNLEKSNMRKHLEDNCSIKNKTIAHFYVWISLNTSKFIIILMWVMFALFGAIWLMTYYVFSYISQFRSCIAIQWSFIDGLYFALSSMSTGGLYAVCY